MPLAKSPGVCRILDASQADTQPDSSLAFRKSSFRLYTLSGYHGYGLAREGHGSHALQPGAESVPIIPRTTTFGREIHDTVMLLHEAVILTTAIDYPRKVRVDVQASPP